MMTEFGHIKPAKNTLPASTGPRSRTATIYDVAKIAGVSAQSVSRYVRGHTMRETTREKIEAALESVHYSPNLTARALISGKSQRIGLLVHGLDQIGPSRIVQGAAAASRAAGYVMDMVVVDMSDTTSINEAVLTLTDHGAAGIGALASTDEMLTVLNSASSAMPFVLAAEDEAGPHTNSSETSESGSQRWWPISFRLAIRNFFTSPGRPRGQPLATVEWLMSRPFVPTMSTPSVS